MPVYTGYSHTNRIIYYVPNMLQTVLLQIKSYLFILFCVFISLLIFCVSFLAWFNLIDVTAVGRVRESSKTSFHRETLSRGGLYRDIAIGKLALLCDLIVMNVNFLKYSLFAVHKHTFKKKKQKCQKAEHSLCNSVCASNSDTTIPVSCREADIPRGQVAAGIPAGLCGRGGV